MGRMIGLLLGVSHFGYQDEVLLVGVFALLVERFS